MSAWLALGLSSRHKTRDLSPPICAMLTPSNCNGRLCHVAGRAPMRVGLEAHGMLHDSPTRVILSDARPSAAWQAAIAAPRWVVAQDGAAGDYRRVAACSVTLSRREGDHGLRRISLRAPVQHPNDGGGGWGLDRCRGGRDRRHTLPGAPTRGRASRRD